MTDLRGRVVEVYRPHHADGISQKRVWVVVGLCGEYAPEDVVDLRNELTGTDVRITEK